MIEPIPAATASKAPKDPSSRRKKRHLAKLNFTSSNSTFGSVAVTCACAKSFRPNAKSPMPMRNKLALELKKALNRQCALSDKSLILLEISFIQKPFLQTLNVPPQGCYAVAEKKRYLKNSRLFLALSKYRLAFPFSIALAKFLAASKKAERISFASKFSICMSTNNSSL